MEVTKGPEIFQTVTLSAKPASGAVNLRYEPTAFRVGLYALCLALGGVAATIAAAGTEKLGRNRRL